MHVHWHVRVHARVRVSVCVSAYECVCPPGYTQVGFSETNPTNPKPPFSIHTPSTTPHHPPHHQDPHAAHLASVSPPNPALLTNSHPEP